MAEKNLVQDIVIVKNLRKKVMVNSSELEIIKSISLNVKSGESVAIVGPSGCGKSTLLSLLAGLDSPSEGEIWLDNAPVHRLNEEQRSALRTKNVGFIFQSFLLIPALTALENIMLPAQLAGIDNPQQQAKLLLDNVGLSHRSHHYPNQLSGGEQQRVAIARAFICQPKILFADEPTGNLDSANGQRISQLLFELNNALGTTLILVTHDVSLANHCQRLITINDGKIVEISHTKEQSNVV